MSDAKVDLSASAGGSNQALPQYNAQPGYPGYGQPQYYPQQQQGYPPPPQGYPQQGFPPGGYGPPGYYPPPQQTPTVIVQSAVGAGGTAIVPVGPIMFASTPVSMTCPHCRASIVTTTQYEVGGMTWLVCMLLFFFTLCCFWIAFIIDDCKDVVHTCPNCRTVVGRYNRM